MLLHQRSNTYSPLVFFVCIFLSLSCHAAAEAGCWIRSLSSQPTTEEVGDLEMLKMDFEFGPRLPSPAAASRLSTAFLHQFCLSSAASPAVHPHAAEREPWEWEGGGESRVSVTLKEEIPKRRSEANY